MFSRQYSGHVLPDDPFRINLCASSEIFEHELAAWIVQSLPEAGDREGLAGASSHNDICRMVVLFPVNFGHVSQVRNVWIMVFEYRFGERFDFGVCDWLPSEWLPGHCRRFDAAEQADVAYRAHCFPLLVASCVPHHDEWVGLSGWRGKSLFAWGEPYGQP